jgi:hypothetical protein
VWVERVEKRVKKRGEERYEAEKRRVIKSRDGSAEIWI